MINTWFGRKPWGNICKSTDKVEIPIGAICAYCNEIIGPDDDGIISNVVNHRECMIRSVVGSIGHQTKNCSCFGGKEEDPQGCTKREAAIIACAYFEDEMEKNGRNP